MPTNLYKITTLDLWTASQGKESLKLAPSDQAFIHLSEQHSVEKIIKKFFAGNKSVMVLIIDATRLKGQLVKEKNPGGTNEYYHLYDGCIPHDAIVRAQKTSTKLSDIYKKIDQPSVS